MYSCTTPHSHVHTSKHTSKQVNTHANTPPTPSLGKSRQISFQYAHRKPKTGNGKWKAVLENNSPISHTHSLSLCPQTSAVTLKGLQWKKTQGGFSGMMCNLLLISKVHRSSCALISPCILYTKVLQNKRQMDNLGPK